MSDVTCFTHICGTEILTWLRALFVKGVVFLDSLGDEMTALVFIMAAYFHPLKEGKRSTYTRWGLLNSQPSRSLPPFLLIHSSHWRYQGFR